ncbi:hypothetical protein [Escherichia phage pEC-M2929-1AR.1]|nr:hypothetical protein [Escherichia phage pEC-M2929-1AR.1]
MLFLLYGEGTRERETNTAPARYSVNEKNSHLLMILILLVRMLIIYIIK